MTKKYNPGHFVQQKSAGTDDPATLDFALLPGFRGALVDMAWAELEPRRGQYDFLTLRRYLAWAEENDRQLIVLVMDRDFRRGPGKIVPRWLADVGLTEPFNKKAGNVGSIAAIWSPRANDYRIELLQAIAADFDSHPRLEAVALPETALGGITGANTQGYSRSTYCDEIIRLINAVAPAMPRTQLWQSINWLGPADSGDLERIATAVEGAGAGGLTNPDTVPWEAQQKPMYDVMQRFAGSVAIAAGGDTSQFGDPANNAHYRSLAELVQLQYQFGQTLGANYQLWNSVFTSRDVSGIGNSAAYRRAIASLVADPHNSTIDERPTSWGKTAGKEKPVETAPDREALRAWLAEADELVPQLQEFFARGKALVG